MRILVSGANGQLGRELMRLGTRAGLHMIPAARPNLDITRPASVAAAVRDPAPDLVVNAAAFTDVDGAETQVRTTFQVNRDGPAYLAAACADVAIPLIHISTDYVFDGLKNEPYVEADPIAPVGVYARSKAEGEAQVRALIREHFILRTSWLFSPFGRNFVKTMLRLGKEREGLTVVADQFGTPTSASDLAEAILAMAALIRRNDAPLWGTYHYAGQGVASWYRFAQKIFEIAAGLGLFEPPPIEPVSSDQYPTRARRPPYSALDCTLIRQKLDIVCRPWPESLKTVMQRIARDAAAPSR